MAEGKNKVTWNHTAAMLALMFNVHRDSKKTRAKTALDFHPFADEMRGPRPKADFGDLRSMFVKEGKGKKGGAR